MAFKVSLMASVTASSSASGSAIRLVNLAWVLSGASRSGPPNDLHDLCQAGAVAHSKRVFTPDPVETFLRHTKCYNNVHIVAVCLHFSSAKAFLNLALIGWVNQVSNTQHSPIETFD
jgi:hypothetical protein